MKVYIAEKVEVSRLGMKEDPVITSPCPMCLESSIPARGSQVYDGKNYPLHKLP